MMMFKPNQIIAARLKGGQTVHALRLNENGKCEWNSPALCGKKPSKKTTSSMNRAGWYGYKEGSVAINCNKCQELQAAGKEIEE